MADPIALAVPAFIAGLITFLAPCTLPLVPAFLGFIGGASADNGTGGRPQGPVVRRKVVMNALYYVAGFTSVFVLMGTAFGIGGSLLADHRDVLARIGGIFVIAFGLYMMGADRPRALRFLERERRLRVPPALRPGRPSSSFAFGATFALGWSPCVGPILGSILLLASASATALQGGLLLLVFSLGLATPFMALAFGFGHAAASVRAVSAHLGKISLVGGAFLVFLGVLMATGRMEVWLTFAFRLFSFADYGRLLDLL